MYCQKLPPPNGYNAANDIVFKLENGIISVKQQDGTYKPVTELEEKQSFTNEAYTDTGSTMYSWSGQSFGKLYYLAEGEGLRNQIIYCMNLNQTAPIDSSNNGESIEYVPPFAGGDGEVKYSKTFAPEKLVNQAITPRVTDPQGYFQRINKILYAGYPNNMANLQNGISNSAFRAITQLAIYYYSDSFDIDQVVKNGGDTHDFGGIADIDNYAQTNADKPPANKTKDQLIEELTKIREVYDALLNYAENGANPPDNFKTNLYVPKLNRYQVMLGTEFIKAGLGYVITMEDEEKPAAPVTADVTFSKVEVNGSAELPNAELKVVVGEDVNGTIAKDSNDSTELKWTSSSTARKFTLGE
ncbi:thioester-forming surface-anchored protein, partial [Criibacterium bergeronii]